MVKVINIIGVRPNLTKFINITGNDFVVWTGQHHDKELLSIGVNADRVLDWNPKADMVYEEADLVVVYGDTYTAEWGAHYAFNNGIPLAHIEAGVRLGDLLRPEEAIRISIDKNSQYLFCVNDFHAENLRKEKVKGKIFVVGDLHYDKYLKSRSCGNYGVLTIHRREHISDSDTLQKIFNDLKKEGLLYFYCHPHTKKKIEEFGIKVPGNIKVSPPVPYGELMAFVHNAKFVITDSGGLTREAYFSGTPVKNIGKTEWAREVGMFGDGHAGDKIREILLKELQHGN